MIKKLSMIAALTLAATAVPAQAAVLATWDVSASIFGTITDPVPATISGSDSGGTATLDSDGSFSVVGLDNLLLNLNADPLLGGATLDLAVIGEVNGVYDPLTQQLSGNIATVTFSENNPCTPLGLLGAQICDAVPGVIDFSQPLILTAAEGLADPITFDLVSDFRFLLGELGGVAELELSLTNVQVVPLPAAVWLFGSALLGLAGAARGKRQSKV
ncbi:hypothetical protein EYC98_06325 [Halieaceae bacterium IMCC14734]|uniref:VPLPA-CTERM sorting domain-containing protein n=1 Tax=Candidatus Litorirhabdus singularis TaxID=2518993 RepID=A0ABT3TGE1_9GAMM|nr:VPLPA-CTERM sorting domain-containing protein [Candidatus Litorirhabdus singularis]MCX2980489.1 hypothetical protein [Candidatus Litorirhabdus singularis]